MNIDRATASQATMKHRKPKSGPPVRSSELVRPRRCKRRKCEAEALTNGLCCHCYLEALDKFEAQSRKAKGIVARSND